MNEDYLWDKSGEPDPEIERLEQTLGRLRYKRLAEPLPLPASTRWSSRLSFSTPALAAAAALFLLILAGGLWLGLRRSSSTEGNRTIASGPTPTETRELQQIVSDVRPSVERDSQIEKKAPQDENKLVAAAVPNVGSRRDRLSRRSPGARPMLASRREPSRSSRERREQIARDGEKAKEQLIFALHIASEKLNRVQKKIQTNQERGPV
jgi:hypothetical protein